MLEYEGKLYGRVGRKTFDTGKTSEDWDNLMADKLRIDWLADPKNEIGNVQLPVGAVMENIGSLREAIDAAMSGNFEANMPLVEPGYPGENVRGHPRRADAEIDQTPSSASDAPPCSTSFFSLEDKESWKRDLVRLGNNLALAWEVLHEDPPFIWRAKRLIWYSGGCLQNILPEGQQVGNLRSFAEAVRSDHPTPYHSPQECPKCAQSTSNQP
jgi:hypothetical protein